MNHFKRKLTTFTAMLAFLSLSSTVVFAGGVDGSVIGATSNMGIKDSTNRTDVNLLGGQANAVGQVDWNKFSINAGNQVNFGFSGISQTIVNRVLGGETSRIMGMMTSSCIAGSTCTNNAETGKVILINPAGVIFGAGSQVDINSITTSTFDMKGAKNLTGGLKSITDKNYGAHMAGTQAAYDALTNARYSVNFDSNYTSAFKEAGLTNADDMVKNSSIELDGATFSHWARNANNTKVDFNNELTGDKNTNVSYAFVSNNIDYKDSLLRTGGNYNYIAGTGNKFSRSNVKLVTADGVTFGYNNMGYINSQAIVDDANDQHPDLARTITMDNTNILAQDPTKAAIDSGNVYIGQKSNVAPTGAEASVKLKNTIIKANKLVNREDGAIQIVSTQDVLVDNTRLATTNAVNDTIANNGGAVTVQSTKNNVTIKNSNIVTSGSSNSLNTAAGEVDIIANGGNVNIENTKVLADGNVKVAAGKKANVNNSLLYANNVTDAAAKDLTVIGQTGVDITNSDLAAKGNTSILAADSSSLTGDINIKGDNTKSSAANDANQPGVKAGKKLTIQGKNTTIDNVTLAYENTSDLSFYDANKTGVNNVTIKNNTAFTPANSNDITVETNGNLTFDNATVQKQNFEITDVQDNKTVNGISYKTPSNPTRTNANNLNIKSTQGNVTVQNKSNIAANNINADAAKDYTQYQESNMLASNNNTINANDNVTITDKSTVLANNNTSVKAKTGDIMIGGSNIIARNGNADVVASAGKIDVGAIGIAYQDGSSTYVNSKVEAGNDVNMTAKNDVTIDRSQVIAGSDSANYDANDTAGADGTGVIGDANITSQSGSVNIKHNSKVLSQDKDVNITAYNTVKFGNASGDNIDKTADITALHNAKIASTNGNIEGEKTTMPTIKYGDRLTFDANKSNIFTSQDSLKSVNVDYKAGVSNQIYTQSDAQFVNSTFEAPNNFVESGKDVILNNLEIKSATADAKDTVTEIFANGNVTTYNVTGENLGAKDAGEYHSYPQSVDTNRVAKGDKTMPEYVKGLDSTTLDANKTKLKVTTDTVKDAANPDNGSITLVLQDADNTKAGVELKARNVKALDKDSTDGYFKSGYYKAGDPQWDENIAPKEGPEIVLNANDNKLAVKELYSDKLTLDPNDKMFADNTDGTPVITVKDQGGLNLDPTLDYTNPGPDKFTYDRNYDSKDKTVTGGDLTFDEWSEWKPTGKQWSDPDGTLHTEYESTRDGRITDRITTQTDQRHTITFDNEGNPGEFTLVYDKKSTTVEPGREITAQQVKDDPTVVPPGTTPEDFIKTKDDSTPCPPKPDPDDAPVAASTNDVSLVTLPREQVEISKTSTVADNTADQTSNIMSAAAKVDLGQEIDANYDDDKDDDID